MMIAKLENKVINLYDDGEFLVGSITTETKIPKAVLTIGTSKFVVTHNKKKSQITENNKTIYNLETDSFWGNTTIIETDKKITGVWGLKWGTQLKDKEENTLLKIRSISKFFKKNKYEIKMLNAKVTNLEILISLYFHIYSSRMKAAILITTGVI